VQLDTGNVCYRDQKTNTLSFIEVK